MTVISITYSARVLDGCCSSSSPSLCVCVWVCVCFFYSYAAWWLASSVSSIDANWGKAALKTRTLHPPLERPKTSPPPHPQMASNVAVACAMFTMWTATSVSHLRHVAVLLKDHNAPDTHYYTPRMDAARRRALSSMSSEEATESWFANACLIATRKTYVYFGLDFFLSDANISNCFSYTGRFDEKLFNTKVIRFQGRQNMTWQFFARVGILWSHLYLFLVNLTTYMYSLNRKSKERRIPEWKKYNARLVLNQTVKEMFYHFR